MESKRKNNASPIVLILSILLMIAAMVLMGSEMDAVKSVILRAGL